MIVGLIAVVAIASVNNIGAGVKGLFTTVSNKLDGVDTSGIGGSGGSSSGGGSAATTPASCAEITGTSLDVGDGIYVIDEGAGDVNVYCNQTEFGGGWMLFSAANDDDMVNIENPMTANGFGVVNLANLANISSGTWSLPANSLDSGLSLAWVEMGSIDDFYQPNSGQTVAAMLSAGNLHDWADNPAGPFVTPIYHTLTLQLGSAPLWPFNNVAGDDRENISFIGLGALNSTQLNGCCHLIKDFGGDSVAAVADSEWGRAYKVWVR